MVRLRLFQKTRDKVVEIRAIYAVSRHGHLVSNRRPVALIDLHNDPRGMVDEHELPATVVKPSFATAGTDRRRELGTR